MGLFPEQDLSHVLEDEWLEVEPVGGVEVCGHRFGVVVDEDRILARTTNGVDRMHASIVELDALPDANWT